MYQGGRGIMTLLGYTQVKSDGVAFPADAEPDQGRVLNIVIDIFQGRKELEAFLEDKHPYPEKIKTYFSDNLR